MGARMHTLSYNMDTHVRVFKGKKDARLNFLSSGDQSTKPSSNSSEQEEQIFARVSQNCAVF